MLTTLIIGLFIAAAISVVTVHALRSAPEGYEDESGFHALSPVGNTGTNRQGGNTHRVTSADDLPPFAAAR